MVPIFLFLTAALLRCEIMFLKSNDILKSMLGVALNGDRFSSISYFLYRYQYSIAFFKIGNIME